MNSDFDKFSNIPVNRFESMLKTNKVFFFDATEFEEIGQYYIDTGNLALAKKALQIGEQQHPSAAALKILKVEYLLLNNKIGEAENIIDFLFELEPHNDIVYLHKSVILSKKNMHEEAILMLRKALNFSDEPYELYALLAMEYLYIDSFLMAKECFIKCLELDPNDQHALYNVVYCFESLHDPQGAISFMDQLLNNDPYNEIIWHQLGRQYVQLKQYKEAITAFDFAIICDDTFIGAHMEMGKTLEKLGKFNEAINFYEMTLSIDDPTAFALFRLGSCHSKLGNKVLALRFFKKTIHHDPLFDKGWIALAEYHIDAKDFNKARYYINKALQIDNSNGSYWKLYAKTNEVLGFLEEVDVAHQELTALGNYELETWLSWAKCLLNLKDYEKGIEVMKQALDFYPENSKFNFLIAGFYLMLKREREAAFFLKNAYLLDPKELNLFYLHFPEFNSSPLIKRALTI